MNVAELTKLAVEPSFLDTNIFVYSFDNDAPGKQRVALQLIEMALRTEHGMISSQVVQEFLSLAGRKFAHPLGLKAQRAYLSTVLRPLCQHYPSEGFYERALDIVENLEAGLESFRAIIASLNAKN